MSHEAAGQRSLLPHRAVPRPHAVFRGLHKSPFLLTSATSQPAAQLPPPFSARSESPSHAFGSSRSWSFPPLQAPPPTSPFPPRHEAKLYNRPTPSRRIPSRLILALSPHARADRRKHHHLCPHSVRLVHLAKHRAHLAFDVAPRQLSRHTVPDFFPLGWPSWPRLSRNRWRST